MPVGIAGEVTREQSASIEAIQIMPDPVSGHPASYGVPLAIDTTTGHARTLVAADTAANVYGILVRPFPSGSSLDGLGVSTPPKEGLVDALRKGYCCVVLSGDAAAAKGQPVYIWTAAASGSHIVGGFEATSPGDSGAPNHIPNGFQLLGANFQGPADTDGNVEISVRFGP
jgi:hypothetical protein